MDVTVQEAKTQLSKLLRRVEAGEEVTIRRGKVPVAVLVRAPAPTSDRRIWGDVDGELTSEFDAPLDDFSPFQ
jgi:prevent-host-death family protein